MAAVVRRIEKKKGGVGRGVGGGASESLGYTFIISGG